MTLPKIDAEEYRERIATAVLEAITVNSIIEASDGSRVAAILSAEVVDVLSTTIAIIAAGSEACSTPTKVRQFCDDLARRIQRRIAEAKRVGTPFENMTVGEPS